MGYVAKVLRGEIPPAPPFLEKCKLSLLFYGGVAEVVLAVGC